MSSIDKDSKAKVSDSSDKKFLIGFLDGWTPIDKNSYPAILTKLIRRAK
jgi:hypothetical protein